MPAVSRAAKASARRSPTKVADAKRPTTPKKKPVYDHISPDTDHISSTDAPPAVSVQTDIHTQLAELLSPCHAAIDSLQAQAVETQKRLDELSLVAEVVDSPAGAGGGAAAPRPVERKDRKRLVAVWRAVAAEHLAEMASSLDGALINDAKLKELFDRIDLDMGGTIDQHELECALEAVGQTLSPAAVEAMMRAADEDANGEIDFEEFSDILRNHIRETRELKPSSLTSGFRKQGRSSTSIQPVAEASRVASREAASRLSRWQVERLLGNALILQKANLRSLVAEWDRSHKGARAGSHPVTP